MMTSLAELGLPLQLDREGMKEREDGERGGREEII